MEAPLVRAADGVSSAQIEQPEKGRRVARQRSGGRKQLALGQPLEGLAGGGHGSLVSGTGGGGGTGHSGHDFNCLHVTAAELASPNRLRFAAGGLPLDMPTLLVRELSATDAMASPTVAGDAAGPALAGSRENATHVLLRHSKRNWRASRQRLSASASCMPTNAHVGNRRPSTLRRECKLSVLTTCAALRVNWSSSLPRRSMLRSPCAADCVL